MTVMRLMAYPTGIPRADTTRVQLSNGGRSYSFEHNRFGHLVADVETVDRLEMLALGFFDYTEPADGSYTIVEIIRKRSEPFILSLRAGSGVGIDGSLYERYNFFTNHLGDQVAIITEIPNHVAQLTGTGGYRVYAAGIEAVGGGGTTTPPVYTPPPTAPAEATLAADGNIDIAVSTVWGIDPGGALRTITASNTADTDEYLVMNTGSSISSRLVHLGERIRYGRGVWFRRVGPAFIPNEEVRLA